MLRHWPARRCTSAVLEPDVQIAMIDVCNAILRWSQLQVAWVYLIEDRVEIRLMDNDYKGARSLIRALLDEPALDDVDWIVFSHPSHETDTVLSTRGIPDGWVGPSA